MSPPASGARLPQTARECIAETGKHNTEKNPQKKKNFPPQVPQRLGCLGLVLFRTMEPGCAAKVKATCLSVKGEAAAHPVIWGSRKDCERMSGRSAPHLSIVANHLVLWLRHAPNKARFVCLRMANARSPGSGRDNLFAFFWVLFRDSRTQIFFFSLLILNCLVLLSFVHYSSFSSFVFFLL
jgi:hypothetical protein